MTVRFAAFVPLFCILRASQLIDCNFMIFDLLFAESEPALESPIQRVFYLSKEGTDREHEVVLPAHAQVRIRLRCILLKRSTPTGL